MTVTIIKPDDILITCACGAELRYTQNDIVRFTMHGHWGEVLEQGYGIKCPSCKGWVRTDKQEN